MILIHITVCQDQDICAAADHSVYFYKKILNSFLKTCVLIICNRDLSYLESLHLHVLDF